MPYFGAWPVWFPAFLVSCSKNQGVHWKFFTDYSEPPVNYENISFHQSSLQEIRNRIAAEIGFLPNLTTPYKLCDFRPLLGAIFSEYVAGFDFWGHCDIDVVWGDIRNFATDKILDSTDVFSTRKGRLAGHCTLYRNTPRINQLYRQHPMFNDVVRTPHNMGLDETMSWLIRQLADASLLRVHWPKFLLNYANPRNDYPSRLPMYVNKYMWEDGKLFEDTEGVPQEILYLHFMTWKDTLKICDITYNSKPKRFFVSYSGITSASC